jgi:hypothetical protein
MGYSCGIRDSESSVATERAMQDFEKLGVFYLGRAHDLASNQAREGLTSHLEVETYTWDVLPEEYRRESVVDAIARELRWTAEQLR